MTIPMERGISDIIEGRTYKKMANAGEGGFNHQNGQKIYGVRALKNLSDVLI